MAVSVGLCVCALYVWLYVFPLPCIGLTIHVDKESAGNITQCSGTTDNATCGNLVDALAMAQQVLGSNDSITILLAPGKYHLGSNRSLSTFVGARKLTIRGTANMEAVVINCNNTNGFAFSNSIELTFESFVLEQCMSQGAMPEELRRNNVNIHVALAVYNSSHVTMNNVAVRNNNGIGVMLYNTFGTNKLYNCSFINNRDLNDNGNDTHRVFGGLMVMLFYCFDESASHNKCALYIKPTSNLHPHYEIDNCVFADNNSTTGEFMEPSISVGLDHFRERVTKGGGLSLLMHGHASNTTIYVRHSKFLRNSASWGGGAHLCFRDFCKNNIVHFNLCVFDSNMSPTRTKPGGSHGGGADVVYLQKNEHDVVNNNASFTDCHFINNTALFGGGLSVQMSDVQAVDSDLSFTGCVFEGNSANMGAAADLSMAFQTARFGHPTGRTRAIFSDCSFHSNAVMPDTVALNQTRRIGNGILYIYHIQTLFKGNNTFESNDGTGLVLATLAVLWNNSHLIFKHNRGSFGGGMRFAMLPRLDLRSNTSLQFIGNTAKYLGGAFYASYGDPHSEVYQSSCFLRDVNDQAPPDDWSTRFLFENNTCMNRKNSVWVSSLIPCFWLDADHPDNSINTTFCWKNWNYVGSSCLEEISSLGTELISTVTNTTHFFPGIPIKPPIELKDDLGHDVSGESILAATVTKGEAVMENSNYFRADSDITILGVPNSTIEVTLQTQGPSGFTYPCHVHLEPCPPGFVQYNVSEEKEYANTSFKCVCGGTFHGTVMCHSDKVSATIMDGFSMSFDETCGQTVVGPVPYEVYSSVAGRRPLPQLVSQLDEMMCGELNRTGLLCSQCRPGLSLRMTFSSLHCINCTMGVASSWLVFVALQFLPTTLFFLLVILGNINAASASFNAFIFFSQVMSNPLSNRLVSPWYQSIGEKNFINTFREVEGVIFIPYSSWNLDFRLISIFRLPACFVSGNNILLHTTLGYLNALYPLLLIGLAYLLITLHSKHFRPVVWLWRPFRTCYSKFRRTLNPQLSIINAFATFVIVSYVQFLTTSVKLLAFLQLYSSDHNLDEYRYFFDASKPYFKGEHLPYALVGMVIMCVVIIPTPVLMFLYPLKPVQRAMSCRHCHWQGLRTFVEAMQGCFKDGTNGTKDRRFFAGLYFVFRIVLIVTLGVATSFTQLYTLTISFIIVMILLFILLEPYKDAFYNKFDTVIFVIMLSVHTTNFFNLFINIAQGELSVQLWAVSQALLVLPLLYVIIASLQLLWRKSRLGELWEARRQQKRTQRLLEESEVTVERPNSYAAFKRDSRRRKRSSLMAVGRPGLVTISEITLSDELPDRLVNPGEYLYETLEEHIAHSPPHALDERQLTDSQNTLYGSLEDNGTHAQELRDLSTSRESCT